MAAILKEVHQTIKAKQIRVFPSKEKERDETDKRPPRVELNPPKVAFEDVKNGLADIKDPQEQMKTLVQLLELTNQDIADRQTIATYIQESVSELYPKAKVYLFGSTVNGLGFKGCDIDSYVETGDIEIQVCLKKI